MPSGSITLHCDLGINGLASVWCVIVEEGHRRKGFGTMIVAAITEHALKTAKRVELVCWDRMETFYKNNGYVVAERLTGEGLKMVATETTRER